jgi:hypothetical protein
LDARVLLAESPEILGGIERLDTTAWVTFGVDHMNSPRCRKLQIRRVRASTPATGEEKTGDFSRRDL